MRRLALLLCALIACAGHPLDESPCGSELTTAENLIGLVVDDFERYARMQRLAAFQVHTAPGLLGRRTSKLRYTVTNHWREPFESLELRAGYVEAGRIHLDRRITLSADQLPPGEEQSFEITLDRPADGESKPAIVVAPVRLLGAGGAVILDGDVPLHELAWHGPGAMRGWRKRCLEAK